jgi:hypothetical protein
VAAGFVGRTHELSLLTKRLDRIRESGVGVAVTIRGRRQVGKSRLAQEFCDRAGLPYVFFAATKGASPVEAVSGFADAIADSTLRVGAPGRALTPSPAAGSWADVFRVLADALPERPSIVVIDELPWLSEQDDVFDGALQTAWDRMLALRPVLLLLLGSDLHMMARLTSYDRPFFGRADNMVLGPLNPAEVGTATGLGPLEAIDAHLITGGLPGVLRSWPHGLPPLRFLEQECADPAAPVFSVPESALLAEFPAPDHTRRILEAIGGGDRTHANIAAAAGTREGALPSGILSPLLRRLVEEKGVVAAHEPLSTRPGRPPLYYLVDTSLRLYLAVLRSAQEQARRGRPDTAFRLVQRRWQAWRGRAVEPLIRDALLLAGSAGRLPWSDVEVVGGWWNRQFDPEIDLVGADRAPVARDIAFVGSIKWQESEFDPRHLADLRRDAPAVPGFTAGRTALIAVSAVGYTGDAAAGLDLTWGPADVVGAWER